MYESVEMPFQMANFAINKIEIIVSSDQKWEKKCERLY
jgi:hypothetical protein